LKKVSVQGQREVDRGACRRTIYRQKNGLRNLLAGGGATERTSKSTDASGGFDGNVSMRGE